MDITTWGLVALAAAALLVGFSKTAVNGANTISLAVFAAVLPARESTGALLPLLLVGDVIAVITYRRHAHWPTLLRMFPAVAVGVGAGTLFVAWAGDTTIRRSIGAILLFMVAVTLWRRRVAARAAARDEDTAQDEDEDENAMRGEDAPGAAGTGKARLRAQSYGVAGGFTTMVANAGGPVMSLYLLSAGFRKLGFLGTSAWFFLVVNAFKVPFMVGLDLINADSLKLDAMLALAVVLGALVGRAAVTHINQRLFDRLVIAATVIGGLQLLLR
ncbi:sulfite exporter TauE/SafE family protein [Streptomyces sp. GC420]|uniref:sulfite exporter TauE/SafE family protein n=1 Tax=Streptomyces sp. GC420 TaxID=2697568 RepID=UPI001414FA78|nr:sulfite exporter TauE/SafE family protein [Streptomyces sp. GC420]NBM15514.1 TSUP family transporter [Streptomyces sp. GC420]